MKRFLTILVSVIVVGVCAMIYYHFYYVFGEGVKSGELNYMVRKGYIFKTNEGRLIQAGIRSNYPGMNQGGQGSGQGSSIQSNEFTFSVTDQAVMKKLELSGGATLQLHYKEYLGTLPWRGMSTYVVDSIISVIPQSSGPSQIR